MSAHLIPCPDCDGRGYLRVEVLSGYACGEVTRVRYETVDCETCTDGEVCDSCGSKPGLCECDEAAMEEAAQ